MEKNQNIAIVILNWNGKNWLEKFLPAVVSYAENAKIYVIDNASTDDSVSFLEKYYPDEIIQIFNKKNYGFAKGYNEGLKQVKEDIYCLLNSDVEVTHNWLTDIYQLFENNKNIAALQPKILSFHDKDNFEFAGAGGGFIDNLGYPYCRGRIFFDLENDQKQYEDFYKIFWATGACFFIRKEDFWEQNGFDEYFFAHMEEIDLCWRLHHAKREIYYYGKSTVYHVGGGTLNVNNPRKTYLNFRNNLLMLLKNLPFRLLFPILFLRLILDGIAGIKFLFSNGFGHIWAVIRAHFGFYKMFFHYFSQRKGNYIYNYYKHKYIIFQYFIRKRKTYKDLK